MNRLHGLYNSIDLRLGQAQLVYTTAKNPKIIIRTPQTICSLPLADGDCSYFEGAFTQSDFFANAVNTFSLALLSIAPQMIESAQRDAHRITVCNNPFFKARHQLYFLNNPSFSPSHLTQMVHTTKAFSHYVGEMRFQSQQIEELAYQKLDTLSESQFGVVEAYTNLRNSIDFLAQAYAARTVMRMSFLHKLDLC